MDMEDQKLLPTKDIVVKKLSLQQKIDDALDNENYEESDRLYELVSELNEKYDFKDQVFEENGRKGLRDMTGDTLVPPLYAGICETYNFEELRGCPIGVCNENGKCALVTTDGEGTLLTDFEYDNIRFFGYLPYFIVWKGEKVGFIDIDGTVVVPCILDDWHDGFNDIQIIESEGKYGFITRWGLYVEPMYDELDNKNNEPRVRKGDTWGYVNTDGDFVTKDTPGIDDMDILKFFVNF